MGTMIGSLLCRLGLDYSEFRSGLSVSEKELKKTVKAIERTGRDMVNLGQSLSVAVTAPILAMAATSMKAAMGSREAFAQVEAALASMGNASGRSAEQLKAAAGELQRMSTFDDDDILQKVTANLLTFGNVSGEVFDRAQQAALDMSARLGQDLQSSAIQLGKALNDPVKGLTALGRVGVQFSEGQKAAIKAMVAANDIYGAQSTILGELEKQFRGAAKAQRDAAPGADFAERWRTFQEEIGERLMPVLERVERALVSVMERFLALSPEMQTTILVIGGVVAAIGPLLIGLGLAVQSMAPFIAALKMIGGAGGVGLAATSGLIGLTQAIGAKVLAIHPLVAILGVAAVAFAAMGTAAANTRGVVDGFSISVSEADRFVAGLSRKAEDGETAQDVFGGALEQARISMQKAADDAQALIRQLYGVEAAAYLAARALAQQRISEAWGKLSDLGNERERLAGPGLMWGPSGLNKSRSRVIIERRYNDARRQLDEGNRALGALDQDFARRLADHDKAMAAPLVKTGEAAESVGKKMRDGAGSAKKAAREIEDAYTKLADRMEALSDRLYPEKRESRERAEAIADIDAWRGAKKITDDEHQDMMMRLATYGRERSYTIESLFGDAFEPILATASVERVQDHLARVAGMTKDASDKVGVANVRIAKSFKDMADETLSSLERMVNAIKGGGFMGILQSVIGFGMQLGSIGLFGKTVAGRINAPVSLAKASAPAVKAYAKGTNWHPGGMALVGERGPELLNLPRGSAVVPNHELHGMSGTRVQVIPSPYFDVVVNGQIQRAAPAIAGAGAMAAQRQASYRQSRRLG